ncbi:hypothetical protein ACIQAC_13875 [Streptomyces sp. NPDC088387]|uniref:hypothetical protein n=1 Tax=Streptomyces sp. NPDC088387 TaxID=3365859 RepID=UPI0037F69BF4
MSARARKTRARPVDRGRPPEGLELAVAEAESAPVRNTRDALLAGARRAASPALR